MTDDAPEYVEERGGEKVSESPQMAVWEDVDGDHWIVQGGDEVLVGCNVRDQFIDTLDDAGLLPDECTPGENPDPSPGDVADTWIKATDAAGVARYYPLNEATIVEYDPHATQPFTVDGDTPRSGSTGRVAVKTGGWNTVSIERVPFSEVPTDE